MNVFDFNAVGWSLSLKLKKEKRVSWLGIFLVSNKILIKFYYFNFFLWAFKNFFWFSFPLPLHFSEISDLWIDKSFFLFFRKKDFVKINMKRINELWVNYFHYHKITLNLRYTILTNIILNSKFLKHFHKLFLLYQNIFLPKMHQSNAHIHEDEVN